MRADDTPAAVMVTDAPAPARRAHHHVLKAMRLGIGRRLAARAPAAVLDSIRRRAYRVVGAVYRLQTPAAFDDTARRLLT